MEMIIKIKAIDEIEQLTIEKQIVNILKDSCSKWKVIKK